VSETIPSPEKGRHPQDLSARNRWCSCDQARGSLPCLALRHSAVVTFLWRRVSVLHLPASLRSTDITPLQRYYERSDSCSGGLGRPLANRPVLTRCRSPCFTCGTFRPFRLQPPLVAPEAVVCFWSSRLTAGSVSRRPFPRGTSVSWASPFTCGLATTTGRIEFVILRTSHSPPVAPHPVS
jgi:hypothetical protein